MGRISGLPDSTTQVLDNSVGHTVHCNLAKKFIKFLNFGQMPLGSPEKGN